MNKLCNAECTSVDAKRCVFPFVFNGQMNYKCLDTGNANEGLVCSTLNDINGNAITLGYCASDCFKSNMFYIFIIYFLISLLLQ